ncbi:recombinase family protein [Ferruginivarius sediminum]
MSDYGIVKIEKELNKKGFIMRGNDFTVGKVNKILRYSIYTGTYYFNQRSKGLNGKNSPEDWIAVECPAIIGIDQFRKIQDRLTQQNPQKRPQDIRLAKSFSADC